MATLKTILAEYRLSGGSAIDRLAAFSLNLAVHIGSADPRVDAGLEDLRHDLDSAVDAVCSVKESYCEDKDAFETRVCDEMEEIIVRALQDDAMREIVFSALMGHMSIVLPAVVADVNESDEIADDSIRENPLPASVT